MEHVITTRPATESDTAFGLKVHHLSLHDVIVKQFGVWNEERQDEYFYKAWLPKPIEIILINGAPCGYNLIRREIDQIYISELLILPEFQGQGIGTKIVTDLIIEARKKNIPVRLQVLKKNRAQELYRRLGFKDTGTTETHFQMEIY